MRTEFTIPNSVKLSGSSQSRDMDRKTIEEFGYESFTLMEIAASGAASGIRTVTGDNKKGLFICGKGNNAGDALAAARYLTEDAGHSAAILFLMGREGLSPDTDKNYSLLKKLKQHGSRIEFFDSMERVTLSDYDYIVDGIFGTGISGEIREPISGVIEQINDSGLQVFAMDVPSGLNADSGMIAGVSVHAEHTFTFGTNKTGFYLNGAKRYTGRVHFISLPFPGYLRKHEAVAINNKLAEHLPEIVRKGEHKYDGGVVHILAGSEGLTGAAVMAAKSAWKSGAGAVILYSPKKLMDIYEKNLPQIIKVAVGGEADSYFKSEHASDIISKLDNKPGILLAGPGIGTNTQTVDCLFEVLSHFDGRVVLDADGLQDFDRLKGLPEQKRKRWILTPHIGEAKNYLNMKFSDDKDRLTAATTFVTENNLSLLMKGNPSFFINTQLDTFITGYDTLPFSRAGFGDVLAGTIAAYSGITGEQTLSTIQSLITGYKAYQHFTDNSAFGPEHLL